MASYILILPILQLCRKKVSFFCGSWAHVKQCLADCMVFWHCVVQMQDKTRENWRKWQTLSW